MRRVLGVGVGVGVRRHAGGEKRAAEALAAARRRSSRARPALRRRLRGVREEAKAYAGAPEGEEEVAWDGGLERIEWALEDAIEVVDREAPGTDAPGTQGCREDTGGASVQSHDP